MLLEGKTVVVSGVGPGLGREIALAAAKEGANLVLGARRESNLTAVAADVEAVGGKAAYRTVDIVDAGQTEALAAAAQEQFGGIDALVNCAALGSVLGGLETTTEQQWRQVIETNVFGTMNMIRAALPALKASAGSIVMIGSQTSMKPPPEMIQVAYAASKGALTGAMYHLAQELGQYGIRVNTVSPSWMWGPDMEAYASWMSSEKGIDAEQVRAGLDAKTPLRRIAEDDDVADAVVFFCSDRAKRITGQTLLVNSGEFMR